MAALGLAGATGCTRAPVTCAGQCAPPYELQVYFHEGTAPAAAEHVLTSCADHNPVVIRIGKLKDHAGEWSALIYTHVFGNTPRTTGLLRCLHSSGVSEAGWPD
jgi:hypothetical protein